MATRCGATCAGRACFPVHALFVTKPYAFQTRFLRRSLAAFARSGVLYGALAWALRDFAVRPGWDGGNPRPRPPFNDKGLFRRDGSPKPAVALMRRAFSATAPRGR